MRGIRGAITVSNNSKNEIITATSNLINKIIEENQVKTEEIVSMIFTATRDLDKIYPAVAARQCGYENIPLMCYQELNIQDSLDKCIRIMVYINRDCSLSNINHIYLNKAKTLRPDLVSDD
ncbi:MAG: chorismate mutase [Bacillota bacterium]